LILIDRSVPTGRPLKHQPARYRTMRRIERLQRELLAGDAPLRVLAEAHGFYDEFHLSRQFKQVVGCTPSEFRASHRAVP